MMLVSRVVYDAETLGFLPQVLSDISFIQVLSYIIIIQYIAAAKFVSQPPIAIRFTTYSQTF